MGFKAWKPIEALAHNSACAFEPPNPKDETPEIAAFKLASICSVVNKAGKPSETRLEFIVRRWQFAVQVENFAIKMHLKSPQAPALSSP
mmetsp:Transcript_11004/g.19832  ORF Transcript_11004/g.19832 Transcript_11004/m.19832 type:complete len:89 (-) Transcript_11004:333-599(-)